MTAPDVAALAAVNDVLRVLGTPERPLDADSFLAALAAQGWRITFDNLDPAIANPPLEGAKLAVSAQAAPDEFGRPAHPDWSWYPLSVDPSNRHLDRIKTANVQMFLDMKGDSRSGILVSKADIAASEQAAVRAALEGLRAEVEGVWEEWGTLEVTDESGTVRERIKADGERITKEVLAIIDARLAALDA